MRAQYAPLLEALPRLGLAAVLLYGGLLAIDGEVTVGTLVAFSTYVVLLQAPFRTLGFMLMLAQRAAASAGRIYEILDTEAEIVDRPGAVDLVEPRGEVELRDVTFRYGEAGPVLEHLDLHLAPGETVALIGRTGSGKSTIARLLPRFYDASEGAVLVDGHDVRDLTVRSLRAAIGLVLDEPFLFSASVRDNIAYGRPDASDDDVRAAARAAGAEEFIDALPEGFDSEVGERGYTLSGGQRQRVAIARTLLDDPAILILDDATSAIDVQVEEEIHAALRVLMEGRTTLVIAHRLSTINLAERVVLLEGGRIVADGTHAGLMATEPRYAEVLAHIEEDDATRRARAEEDAERAAAARRAGRHRRRTAHGHRAGRPRLMAWGGAASGPAGGFGGGAAAARSGLPFAGVPPELQSRVDQLLEHEPDHDARAGRPTSRSSRTTAPFSLRQLLVPHRLALAGSVALVALETVALQAGPLLTQIAIDDGIRAGDREVVFIGRRAVPRQRVRGRRHQPHPDRVDRPGGRAAALRPAGEGVQPLPAALDRLLLAREGRVA